MCACLPYEMEHLSEEFTNGSSSDATGNNRRFQAENLRQITIYQLMKPLKIIPPILLCPLSSALHYLHEHWLHSEERIWHESQLHCSYYILQSDNSKKEKRKKKDIFGQRLPLMLKNTQSRNGIRTRRDNKSVFF